MITNNYLLKGGLGIITAAIFLSGEMAGSGVLALPAAFIGTGGGKVVFVMVFVFFFICVFVFSLSVLSLLLPLSLLLSLSSSLHSQRPLLGKIVFVFICF